MTPPMRILFLIHHLRTGGVEQFTTTLLPELHNITRMMPSITVLDSPGELEAVMETSTIPLLRLTRGVQSPLLWTRQLATRLNAGDFDILQMQGSSAAFWGCVLTATNPNVVRVVAYHTIPGWHRRQRRWLANRLYQRFVHAYVAVCRAEKRMLTEYYGIPAASIHVIPNCVDSNHYRPGASEPSVRRQLALAQDRPVVGVVGRCSPEKGGDIFIRAMAILKTSGIRLQGVLVGDGVSRSAWEQMANELGVSDLITFAGRIDQSRMPDIIRCFDVGVVPSYQECCSVAILEQMACGIPIVATNVGGNADLVKHGVTGAIVPPSDPDALAAAIRDLLLSPVKREQFGTAARRKIESQYTINAITRQYADLYTSLYRERNRGNAAPTESKKGWL